MNKKMTKEMRKRNKTIWVGLLGVGRVRDFQSLKSNKVFTTKILCYLGLIVPVHLYPVAHPTGRRNIISSFIMFTM